MPGGFSAKFSGTTGAKGYRPTNADRIRSMSDEELAEMLCISGWRLGETSQCRNWLRQPSEEVHDGQTI